MVQRRMRYANDKPTRRIASCKSNPRVLRAAGKMCDFETRFKTLRHIVATNNLTTSRVVYDFGMMRAVRNRNVAFNSRKQELYRLNRPLRRGSTVLDLLI